MKDIFATYVEHSFGEKRQADFKIRQFELNYRRYFPADTDAIVVDIGIGRGEMLSCMQSWGYRNYLGVDISPSTVQFCKSLGLRCQLIDSTGTWLSERAGTIDVITLLDVLEHIKKEDVISLLKAMRGALREGGILIIQVPNLQAPDAQLHRYNDITHEVGYVEHSLEQVLKAAGFTDITFHPFEDATSNGPKQWIRIVLRFMYWSYVHLARRISGNLNPAILSPVFYAVVKK